MPVEPNPAAPRAGAALAAVWVPVENEETTVKSGCVPSSAVNPLRTI